MLILRNEVATHRRNGVHDADITSVDLARRVGENLESTSPDLLRAMVQAFAEALMGAKADALCGTPHGQASEEG